ncbi:MAG: hypothetical protein GF346_11405 [Candidatus Eisenbacteria bacterium]|nr:hypothetical protein [Candidatus Latescibacterota bacterium]MBD3303042.1 hypothetical protein [Candidatus Eisenbacteria bacterium]
MARDRTRRTRRLLVAGSFTLLLGLLLAEGGLRLYFRLAPPPADSRYLPDPEAGYRLRPGPFWEDGRSPDDIVNSFGFRDREPLIPKPDGLYRIVGIGDSFVLGAVPLERNFLRVAEAEAAERFADDSLQVEISMMGLGGYGPENEVGVLRSAALRLSPDLVVLCFYVGNDVTGVLLRGEVLGGELYFTRSSNPLHDLLRRSRLFVLLERTATNFWRLRNLEKERGRPGREEPADPYRPTMYYRLILKKRLPVYESPPSERIERLWRRTESALAEFDRVCASAGVPWILLAIPAEEQVDPRVRARVLESLSVDPAGYDFDAPQRRLRAFADARGIDLIDLLPVFRAATVDPRLYIPNDTHWNEEGNALAGRILADAIIERIRSRPARTTASSGR